MNEQLLKKIIPIIIVIITLYTGYMILFGQSDSNTSDKKASSVTAHVDQTGTTKTNKPRIGTKNKNTNVNKITYDYAYVSYEIDGKSYSNVYIADGASGLKKGDICTVYYYPENPEHVELNASSLDGSTASRTISSLMPFIIILCIIATFAYMKKNNMLQN